MTAAARSLVHPGRPADRRVLAVDGAPARDLRLSLPPGAALAAAVTRIFEEAGIRSATLFLVGGSFARYRYHVPRPTGDGGGGPVVGYGPPIVLDPPVRLLGACAVFGLTEKGPILHCHAAVADRDGRVHGGHVDVDWSLIGVDGMVAYAADLPDAGFSAAFDEETAYRLFHPFGPAANKGMQP